MAERLESLAGPGLMDRLFQLGGESLTDEELLQLLFGRHARLRSLLDARGGLKSLLTEDPRSLRTRAVLGTRRTALLLAALELGRRAQRARELRPQLAGPKELYDYLAPTLSSQRRELFHVLSFNARNVLLRDTRVAVGTVCTCPVDPREVFAEALSARASAIVLAHNHPSGDPTPSQADIALTQQLAQAARLLGIQVMDHLVVGDGAYASFLERQLLPEVGRRVPWRASRGG